MQLAIVAAGFSPGEADQLRRSMAAWKRRGGLEYFRERVMTGMAERGYATAFAEQVFEQSRLRRLRLPESHPPASLISTSAAADCHHPTCPPRDADSHRSLLSPDQLVQDAPRHGVRWPVACASALGLPIETVTNPLECADRRPPRTVPTLLRRATRLHRVAHVRARRARRSRPGPARRCRRAQGPGRASPSRALGGRGRREAAAAVRRGGRKRRATAGADVLGRHAGRLRQPRP